MVKGSFTVSEDTQSSSHESWPRWITAHPSLAICITLGLHLVGVILTVSLWASDVSILPLDLGPRWSYSVAGSDTNDRQVQFETMLNDEGLNMWENILPVQSTRSVEFRGQNIEIIYEGSCFTRDNLASIRVFETLLYNSSGYQLVCQLDENSQCKLPKSPLRFFDGSYEIFFPNITDTGGNSIFRDDSDFNRVQEIITDTVFFADGRSSKDSIRLQGDPDIKKILDYHVGRPGLDYNENNPATATYCRSMFYVGYPLVGYNNIKSDVEAQKSNVAVLQDQYLSDVLERNNRVGSMNMYFSSQGLRSQAYDEDITSSFMLCIGSAFVAWLGLMHLTRSFVIGTLGSMGIAGTWIWTNLVYRGILWVEYFGLPQHLSVFVCGFIGITSVLLLFSSWDKEENRENDFERLKSAMGKSNKIAATNAIVGGIAFWIFCFSKVQVVMPFCLFLGTFCFANYVNFYIFLPTVLAFHSGVLGWGKLKRPDMVVHLDAKCATLMWYRAVGHKWVRWIGISLSCVAIAVLAIFVASKLTLNKQQPKIWTSDAASFDNYGVFEDLAKVQFGGTQSDTNTKLKIVFGVDKFDKHSCHPGSFKCPSSIDYEEAFDLTSGTAQQQLSSFCNDLMSLDTATVNLLKIRRQRTGAMTDGLRPLEVRCFIKAQEDYYAANANPISLPFNFTDMRTVLLSNNESYPPTVYSSTAFYPPYANGLNEPSCRYCDSYFRHQEFGMLDWITDGGNVLKHSDDLSEFVNSIGGVADQNMIHINGQTIYAGHYGSVIRYATVEVNLTLNSENAEHSEALDVKAAWDSYLRSVSLGMMQPFQSVFQTCQEDRTWSWMEVQSNIIASVAIGVIIGCAIVGLSVLILTNNIILAFLATLAVVSGTVCVLGIFAAEEWNIGIVELLNTSIVVGMLSQMTIPFVLSYSMAPSEDRDERALFALQKNFLAIFGGGFISLLSAIFLLASPLWYFWTFAATYLMVLGLGIVLGLLFLVALCGLVGPEDGKGRVFGKFDNFTRQFSNSRVAPVAAPIGSSSSNARPVEKSVEEGESTSTESGLPTKPKEMPDLEKTPQRREVPVTPTRPALRSPPPRPLPMSGTKAPFTPDRSGPRPIPALLRSGPPQ